MNIFQPVEELTGPGQLSAFSVDGRRMKNHISFQNLVFLRKIQSTVFVKHFKTTQLTKELYTIDKRQSNIKDKLI